MGDRIVVMKDGFIQQVDTPQNLYDTPCNLFVAGFIGSPQMNFLPVTIRKQGSQFVAMFGDTPITIPAGRAENGRLDAYTGKEVILGVRPENLHDEPAFQDLETASMIDARIDLAELMGSEIYLYVTSNNTKLVARIPPRGNPKDGDTIRLAIDGTKIHLFDKETEKAI